MFKYLSALRYVTFVLTFSVILTIYLTIPLITDEDYHHHNNNNNNSKNIAGKTRKIVAYSLRKKLELEGERFNCQDDFWNVVEEREDVLEKTEAKLRRDKDLFYAMGNSWVKIPETHFYAYSAHLDRRLDPYRYLRIIGMVEGDWNETLYCQIRSSNDSYQITKAIRTEIWSSTWTSVDLDQGDFNPVLLSCQLSSYTEPIKVSLSTKPCHYSTRTLIVSNPRRVHKNKARFVTVCIKPLDFHGDISDDLMQWIEINKILGADAIDVYVKNVHPNVANLLDFYQSYRSSQVRVHPYPYQNIEDLKPPVAANRNSDFKRSVIRKVWQKRKNELISYNDCFYRNVHASAFVLPVDIDEIIVPNTQHSRTWKEAITSVLSEKPEVRNYASLSVQNAYFLKRFPARNAHESVFFFRHLSRTDFSPPGESTKSFVATENALTVFNHYALEVLRPGLRNVFFLPKTVVQMNHYRQTCSVSLLPECVKYNLSKSEDRVMDKYKKTFSRKYRQILKGFARFNH